jgi:hypothetical protein
MNRFFALVLLTVGLATSAQADYIPATWTDTANVGSGVYIGDFASYTYTHDLTDNGFRPLNDSISAFNLLINLADDANDSGSFFGSGEAAWVYVPGSLQIGSGQQAFNFGASGADYGGWSILGLIKLNVLGTLTVTISSIFGDFNLVGSTLTATGLANVASVPEPGALGLLGIGLMGMALTLRRRQLLKRS